MKKSLLLSSLCIAAVFVSQTAQAEIKIRAGVASSTYTLGGDYVAAKSSYNPTNFGLTWAADNGMYIDVALSGGSGDHNGWAVANAPTTICGGGARVAIRRLHRNHSSVPMPPLSSE